jgi:hypothetical protein
MYGIGNDAFGGQGNQGDPYDYGGRPSPGMLAIAEFFEPTGEWQARHP